MSPFMADIVAKVENRTPPKISRKSIFRRRYCCNALRGRYEDRWSFLYEMMWSLTSRGAGRIGGSENFRSSPQKDFCNNIGPKADVFESPEVAISTRTRVCTTCRIVV